MSEPVSSPTSRPVTIGDDRVRPGAREFEQAVCGLPGCGEPLYIEWTASRPIFLADNARDLSNPNEGYTSSWEVTCGGGHTILNPVDTARDSYTFGECREHDPGEPHDEDCEVGDMDRLRRVIGEGGVAP